MSQNRPIIRAVRRHAVGSHLTHSHAVAVSPLMKGNARFIHGNRNKGASQGKRPANLRRVQRMFPGHNRLASTVGIGRHGEGLPQTLGRQVQAAEVRIQQASRFFVGESRVRAENPRALSSPALSTLTR